jgi:CRISPR-associated protein Cmr2
MPRYIAITFAPIQSFIEKSRKLRDLYGSSFILSFLAKAICQSAEKYDSNCVIVPASTSFTRGVANVIYLYLATDEPAALEAQLTTAFDQAWKALVDNCREYIEEQCGESFFPPTRTAENSWNREWNLWAKHTWELFITYGAEGESLETVRTKMADRKQARNWIGINWRGESSTISGTDAIAYPTMTSFSPQPKYSYEHGIGEADQRIKKFFIALSERMPESTIEPNERLSIPELIKRLITYPVVVDRLHQNYPALPLVEKLKKFTDLQRKESNYWTGWFQGDGDRMGVYIDKVLTKDSDPAEQQNTALQKFSNKMLEWGEALQSVADNTLQNGLLGRIVYAGGDDFFGVLYRDDGLLTPQACLEQWWYGFNNIWGSGEPAITVSTGFVWAAPNVPQRDLLQHLRQTEKAAKTAGKDRLAIRILFNSGNHLDWSCPWQHLKTLLESYQDRNDGENWTHIYNDIATLEARHAFNENDRSVAEGIFNIYFKKFPLTNVELWNSKVLDSEKDAPYQILRGGLLGKRPKSSKQQQAENKLYNQWVIDLAKIGFHLFPDHK